MFQWRDLLLCIIKIIFLNMKTQNLLFEQCKELISLYLKEKDINWPKEIELAKKLLTYLPSIDFWRQYKPSFYVPSLCVFLTNYGKKETVKDYNIFCLTNPKNEIILEEDPVVNVKLENKTPKIRTLEEFVDNVL